jgi:hypothetical protein
VPGFGLRECKPLHASEGEAVIWHTVQWRRGGGGNIASSLRELCGKPVRLCFHLHEASLFSFEFREDA